MKKILFSEKQRGSRKKLLVLLPLVAICAFILMGSWFLRINYNGNALDIDRFSNLNFIVFGILIFAILLLVIVMNSISMLKTRIYQDHIEINFSPLRRKLKKIKSDDIVSFKIRNYRPFREYGGYGIKEKRKYGRAYTISGNVGLQLYFKNGKRLLIGTQKKQAIEYAMEKLMKSE